MHVDSARELKARLSRRLSATPPGTVRASSTPPDWSWSGVTLGLAPVAPGQVHLAVRVLTEADAGVVLEGLGAAARAGAGPAGDRSGPAAVLPHPGTAAAPDPPLVPGLSIAQRDVTAGTLGGFVRQPGRPGLLALSNSHVLADGGRAGVGDPVLQPGPADGGMAADRVGTLTAAHPLDVSGNLVDAAVAALDPGLTAEPAAYPGGPLLATVAAASDVDPDEDVEKIGRTTGHTAGRITAVEVDGVGVQYDDGVVHTFDDQVEIEGHAGSFSEAGDSGSVIWRSRDRAPLGLLFAGSGTGGSNGGGVTFANPLATVLDLLHVEWVAG